MAATVDRCVAISSNKKINDVYYILSFKAPDIAATIIPGQFVNIRIPSPESFLRRPFSVFDVAGDEIVILYKVVGAGTRALAALPEGSTLDVLGPLGNGYTVPQKKSTSILLLGGGTGIASLHFLYKRLRQTGYADVMCALGFQSKQMVVDFADDGTAGECLIYTDDGSAGRKGLVTDSVAEISPGTVVYACGPHAMIDALRRNKKIPTQNIVVSLEERMACGIGACLGCVVETKTGKKTCCKDGPVFMLNEVID